MKKAFYLVIIVALAAGAASAQKVSLRVGQQRTTRGIHIHFVEVLDDSRCPVGTTCIWAGNAKVSLGLSHGKTKVDTMELNSTLDPKGIEYAGYRIKFVDLTRRPTKPGAMTAVRPLLTLSITKIKR